LLDEASVTATENAVMAAVLVIANASHAHTAGSPGLTQHNILAVQNGSHAHTTGTIALIQHNILAIQNASHGHSADNVTLTAHEPSILLTIQFATGTRQCPA
jgi:UDP-N-acetylglucosamine enolpyruvyl transferase